MNAKHYVSLEVAKMLKEKGYNEKTDYAYSDNGIGFICLHANQIKGLYSMPTLLEAMDWLEERGIYVEIRLSSLKIKGVPMKISLDDEYQYKYFFTILTRNSTTANFEDSEDERIVKHTDRNECMNAAIKKGVELL